jgi:hypothetical protein
MIGFLLIAWVIYLAVFARPRDYVGQIVALFIGIFSIRSSLLAGAPVFPSFLDLCILIVYFSASLSVLVRWILEPSGGEAAY